jgi:hypothetical protein
MKATEFEFRHQTLIRQSLMAAAVASYVFDREDIVWRFIKGSPARRELEHVFFLVASLLIGAAAALCTLASAFDLREQAVGCPPGTVKTRGRWMQYLGDFLYAVGFASLEPLWGFVLLVGGEVVRILRLIRRPQDEAELLVAPAAAPQVSAPDWSGAFRRQAAKWGIFVSMIIFTITLTDRLVEILACASGLVWAILNLPVLGKRNAR